jgi:predicted Zn finger-like uncharacterized protein
MIIACPACATRYVVPDSAIGVEGRTVRCAKCRHSWFQDGPEPAPAKPAQQEPPQPEKTLPAPTQSVPAQAEAVQTQPAPEPVRAEPPAAAKPPAADQTRVPSPPPVRTAHEDDYRDSVASPPAADDEAPLAASAHQPRGIPPGNTDADEGDAAPNRDEMPAPTVIQAGPTPVAEPDEFGDEISQFDYEPPFRPRRNMMKVWTIAAGLFATVAIGTVGAVSYWGLPDWVPISRPTFALEQPDLVLDFPRDQQERRTLPNGTEYFGASGTVKNVGREMRKVPSILIVLRDERDRIVYSWEIASPKAALAPGETVTINEAVTDIPRAARYVEIGWKPA